MTGMWVAVTAEYSGATFSHRAQIDGYFPARHQALRDYNRLLDQAGGCVRSGLAGWLPPQDAPEPQMSLSEHEKLRAIEIIVEERPYGDARDFDAIKAVLNR